MAECRHCGASLQSPYRFCPMCATPQTDEARTRFKAYIQQQARNFGRGGAAVDDLERRVRYAAGYVAVVAGLATLFDVGGLFFLLAGLALLPPVQGLLEEQIDRPLGTRPTVGAAGALVLLGALVLVFV